MISRRFLISLLPALPAAAQQDSQAPHRAEEDFQPYGDHPRLFLNARRLRLLRRERERTSVRYTQFETLVAGNAQMPEPGFAHALYYIVAGSEPFGRKAIEWALSAAARDVRQIALVFDWCQQLLSESQSKALAGKLRAHLAKPAAANAALPVIRDRALAAIAVAGHDPDPSRAELEAIIKTWWRGYAAPGLETAKFQYDRADSYALFELLHAIRDNTQIDLRDDSPRYFKELPAYHVLSYYPASFPAAENEYRIPFYDGDGDPDLRTAALARAADLSLVSFDTNAQETQFLQGWLIHDRFLMRGTFGIPYEFLWGNPYQPGLSYYHLPLSMHHAASGRLVLRSSWEDDATWFHYSNRSVQFFEDGRRKERGLNSPAPVEIGGTMVHFGREQMEFAPENSEPQRTFIIGLVPNARYDVEVDDEEIVEMTTDSGGILEFHCPPMLGRIVRVRRYTPRPAAIR
jgi:hypothetical protein